MEFKEFVRKVYAMSEPAVDFDAAEVIKPWEHRLSIDAYEVLLDEFCEGDKDKVFGCNMWMLNQGPQLYE